jgi:alginate O-acetyltransferase complex protein AlgI
MWVQKQRFMLFNSLTFIVFFIIVFALHSLPFSWRTKKFNLLLASYIFYAAWNPPFVVLIWVSTIVDWIVARKIAQTDRAKSKKILLLISLCINLGLLGFFKYSSYLLDNFLLVCELLGFHLVVARPNIILPLGISFYTFQTLSYTIDVYRDKTKPCPSFLDFALFVTFFPQLVAGPIMRSREFIPQLREPKYGTPKQIWWGLTLVVIGLFEKTVVADTIFSPIVDLVYQPDLHPGRWDIIVATLAFSGQLFCDFAGYSTCAPSELRYVSDLPWLSIFAFPMPLRGSSISGIAGTFRCRPGYVITCLPH